MSDKLIDENGRYIDPVNRPEQKPEEAGAALAFRVIAKAAVEQILPKKIYRIHMPIGDASVALSDGRTYQFVNDECNVLGKHLEELIAMGAREVKQDRGDVDRVFSDENR
jgi:hypothetical protein